jgi:uncharacterized protein (UPF0548 family)
MSAAGAIGVVIGRPTHGALAAAWRSADRSDPTYRHIGSTLRAGHGRSAGRRLGSGREDFERACAGLRRWACHAGVGATVYPAGAPLTEGGTVLVVLPLGPVAVVVPNRIVEVIEEPTRYGFAYGTLPGHQERGEESFVVELRNDGDVVATITVDAVPASVAARVAAPLVHLAQRLAVRRYLSSWGRHVHR